MLDLERQDIGKVQRISHFSGAGYAILYRQAWHRFSIDIAKLTLAAMLKHMLKDISVELCIFNCRPICLCPSKSLICSLLVFEAEKALKVSDECRVENIQYSLLYIEQCTERWLGV